MVLLRRTAGGSGVSANTFGLVALAPVWGAASYGMGQFEDMGESNQLEYRDRSADMPESASLNLGREPYDERTSSRRSSFPQ